MAELFENFVDDIGLIPKLKLARKQYFAELREEARAEGLAEGRADLNRFTKLTQLLLEAGRTDDLSRAVDDLTYRKELYL